MHKWRIARVEKYKEEYAILGIDLSSAFDTIDRKKLLLTLETFLNEDEMRIIRVLIAETKLTLSIENEKICFDTKVGSPQGDTLSGVLFIVYLEKALSEARPFLKVKDEAIYADDIDFICEKSHIDYNEKIIKDTFKNWNLIVNSEKTEKTVVKRDLEEWRKVKKLGCFLDDEVDKNQRIALSKIAFRKILEMTNKKSKLNSKLKLYDAFVLPVLTYGNATWALTEGQNEKLDSHHRKQLKTLLKIRYPKTISNKKLYEITKSKPISEINKTSRWKSFGHILRIKKDTPAKRAIFEYFERTTNKKFRGRPKLKLPLILDRDLTNIKHNKSNHDHTYAIPNLKTQDLNLAQLELKTIDHLKKIETIAQDRDQWNLLIDAIKN